MWNLLLSSASCAVLIAPIYAAAQTPPATPRDNAQQQLLEKTRDDEVLNELRQQSQKENTLDTDEAAAKIGSSSILSNLPTEQKLSALAQKIQDEPNNLDHYFGYAQTATALGDHGRAAKTYEIMLKLAPNLDRVRLDLGVSYMQLGRLDEAKSELETVLERRIPDQVRNNVETILAQLEEETKEHIIGGSVSFGMHYDSNANSAPASDSILIFDTEIPLGPTQQATDDLQFFAAASLNHTYKPDWAKGDTISAQWKNSLSLYQSEQSSLETLDLKVLSLRTGPDIRSSVSGIKVSPRLAHNHIVLGTHTYLRNTSGEVGIEYPITNKLMLSGSAKHEFRQFENTASVTTYEDRTGSATQFTAGLRWVMTPKDYFNAQVTSRRERTRVEYYDNEQIGVNASYTRLFPYGIFATGTMGYKNTVYDGPDGLISTQTRHDKERSSGLTVGKSITDAITATIGYQYRDINSNILNYKYDNHRFSTAVNIRF